MSSKRVIRIKTEPLKKVSKNVKSYVKRALNKAIETKVEERVSDDEQFNFGADIIRCLTAIGEGDSQNQRSGNKVDVIRIKGRVQVRITPNSNTVSPFPVRMVVVQDKSNTGTLPTVADVFPNMTSAKTATAMQGMDTEVKSELKERFRILYDKTQFMSNINVTEYAPSIKMFYLNKKLKTRVYFNGTADTDESKNAIVAFVIAGTDSTYVKCDSVFRTYFKDA